MFNPDPIVLTREDHIRQINSYWRHKDIDRLRDECIFEDDERVIKRAMAEPVREPTDKAAASIWCGYCGFMGAFFGLIAWQMIR